MVKRLGISELYSSLILLIIISTMGSIVYSYTLDTTMNYEQHFSDTNKKELKRLYERIDIVEIKSEENNISLSVYNYGEFNSSINQVYINDNIVTIYYEGLNENITPYTIRTISLLSPITLIEGENYNIIIVTQNGVVENHYWKK